MKSFMTCLTLLAAATFGSTAATAQTMSAGCVISVLDTPKPIEVTDCDQSGKEKITWETPTAKSSRGCGPVTTTQIAGPELGSEAMTGEYDITYSFMAIDTTLVKMVGGDVDMNSVKIVESKTTFKLKVLPKDVTPPVIAPLKETTLSGNTVPDLKAMISATDNCTPSSELVITQSVAPDTKVTDRTVVKVTVTDKAGNTAQVSVTIAK